MGEHASNPLAMIHEAVKMTHPRYVLGQPGPLRFVGLSGRPSPSGLVVTSDRRATVTE